MDKVIDFLKKQNMHGWHSLSWSELCSVVVEYITKVQ